MKPGVFKNRSIDELTNHFIEQFAVNAGSSAAKEFLDNFAKHILTLPEPEKALAQSKLVALRQMYSIEQVASFRATEKGKKEELSPPSGMAKGGYLFNGVHLP